MLLMQIFLKYLCATIQVMENMKNLVCNNFNRLMDGSPLSKREVAKRIKVNENTLQRWKDAISCPEMPNIEKLAEVFDVSPLEFFFSSDRKATKIPMSIVAQRIASIPDEIYEIAEEYEISEEAWKELGKIIKTLGNKKAVKTKARA